MRNATAGNLPYSCQLSSVVGHKGALPIQAVTSMMGSKSKSKPGSLSLTRITRIQEASLLSEWDRSCYIIFLWTRSLMHYWKQQRTPRHLVWEWWEPFSNGDETHALGLACLHSHFCSMASSSTWESWTYVSLARQIALRQIKRQDSACSLHRKPWLSLALPDTSPFCTIST